MFMFTRCGICCVLAIFERRRGRLGSKISGYGQLAEVAVYFAMSGLPPEADTNRKGRHVRWVPLAAVSRCSELSYETGQWSIRGLRPKKQNGVGTPYIPPMTRRLKCRIDPEQRVHAAGAQAGAARARDDRPARSGGAEA
jgi:hypothetical protein